MDSNDMSFQNVLKKEEESEVPPLLLPVYKWWIWMRNLKSTRYNSLNSNTTLCFPMLLLGKIIVSCTFNLRCDPTHGYGNGCEKLFVFFWLGAIFIFYLFVRIVGPVWSAVRKVWCPRTWSRRKGPSVGEIKRSGNEE